MSTFLGVQHALARVAKAGNSAEPLLSAFKRLDGLVATWSQPVPRPERNRGRAIGRSIARLSDGLGLFVEALTAPTMLVAQELERRGQDLIDQGACELANLDEINRFERISELKTAPEMFGALGLDARGGARADDASIETIDDRLLRAYGLTAAETPAFGLQRHALRYVMVTCLDAEQCEAIAMAMESQLLAAPFTEELVKSPAWQNEYARVISLLSAALYAAGQSDTTDLETISAWMDVVVKCRDGIIRHCLATLDATSVEEFRKRIRASAGGLIKDCAQRYPALGLNEGLSATIRNAAAHLDYDVNEAGCVVTGDKALAPEKFLDQVLSYLEVAVSLTLGCATVLARLGVDIASSRHLSRRDLDAALHVVLGVFGLSRPTITHGGGALRIEAEGSDVHWMTLAAALSGFMEGTVEVVQATLRNESGKRTLYQAELSAYRTFTSRTVSTDPGFAQLVTDFAHLVSATTVDGASFWSGDQWAGASLEIVKEQLGDTLAAHVRRIRRFRGYAEKAGMAEVAANCTAILAAVRQTAPGPQAAAPEAFRRKGRG